jgi:UDP-N-acetylmuramoylalanine--D-glutamate ligase
VPSPGVPREAPILAPPSRRASRRERDRARAPALAVPIVAVTGTNGKSTTTTLVGLALAPAGSGRSSGATSARRSSRRSAATSDVAVAEVSSFQLEWVDGFRPDVAALLNVTPDHLDRHASYEEYRDLKARIFARAGGGGLGGREPRRPRGGGDRARAARARGVVRWAPAPLGAQRGR